MACFHSISLSTSRQHLNSPLKSRILPHLFARKIIFVEATGRKYCEISQCTIHRRNRYIFISSVCKLDVEGLYLLRLTNLLMQGLMDRDKQCVPMILYHTEAVGKILIDIYSST
jgi:hypothetical protein